MRRIAPLLVLAALAAAAPLSGQERGTVEVRQIRVPSVSAGGWIGVHLDMTTAGGPEGRAFAMTVLDVVDGGPADRAGVRPGDRIVRINGRSASMEAFERMVRRLEPGDPLHLALERDGWSRQVTLTAAERPGTRIATLPHDMAVQIESSLKRMDSVRVVLEGDAGVRLLPAGEAPAAGPRRIVVKTRGDDGVMRTFELDGDSTHFLFAPASFEAWVMGNDSARVGLPTADGERALVLERMGPETREAVAAAAEAARARSAELRRVRGEVGVGEARAGGQAPEATTFRLRPLAPYIVGRNRIAGAALTPLNPGLGAYFGLDAGLLVTEVSDGTPAGDAGVRGGDVIVRVDGRPVETLEDLRAAVARHGHQGPLRLSLVREGEPVEVALGR